MYLLDPYEKEIIEGCLRNERKYQKVLYERYKNGMYTILFQMTNSTDEAADLLQEAFIDIYKNLSSYQYKSTLGAWIKTIVVRKGIKNQRKKISWSPILENVEQSIPIRIDESMTGHQIEQSILSLSEGYRTVFLMTEVYGYTHKETAEMLGIAEGTSKSQLSRAKKKLQSLLIELK